MATNSAGRRVGYSSPGDTEDLPKKQDEVRLLESAIRMRNEEQRRKGIELDATCQICMKTKFADGIGHVCNYCNVRCCARCGGKVSLRSNKLFRNFEYEPSAQELLIQGFSYLGTLLLSRITSIGI
ncbi:UNVERIFIED_CONTAM: unc-10 [Trichonephila clavipes]